MSGTVMKFGPQWIRTLTDGAAPNPASDNSSSSSNSIYSSSNSASNNVSSAISGGSSSNNITNNSKTGISNSTNTNNNSAVAGKYKLAEHRYGREEMLALYEPGMEAPEDIKRFAELFVEKARMPMAMTQMSEEEVKLSTRGWNSEAVLRSTSGKLTTVGGGTSVPSSTPGAAAGGAPGSNHIIGGQTGPGGIGSAINRDSRQLSERGAMTAAEVLSSSPRGPPGSLSRVPPSEQRGLLSSLSSRGHPSSTIRTLVGRGPSLYMRSQSHDDDGIGGDGASSAGQVTAGAIATSGNSYENRFGSLNQTRQPSGLRARFEANRPTVVAPAGMSSSAKPIDIKAGVDGESTGKSVFDRLPSKYNNDDKLIRKDINGRPFTQGDWRSREWSAGGIQGAGSIPKGTGMATDERPWRTARVSGAGTVEDWRSGGNPNANPTSSSWYVKTDERTARGQGSHNQENLNPSFGGKRDTTRRPSADDKHGDEDDEPISIQPRHRRDSLPEWSIGDPLSGDKVGSFDASGAFREISRDGCNTLNKVKETERQLHHQQQQMKQSKSRQQEHQQKEHQQHQGNDFEHLERAAEIMVEKWTEEEDQHHERRTSPEYLGNKMNQTSAREHHDAQQQANVSQNNVIDSRKSNQTPQRQEQHQSGQQEQHSSLGGGAMIASQAFDSTNNPQKFVLLPANHEDSQQWFYRDTQGVVQGPFSANDMCEWYKAGYFVKELLVRRACDELFYPLGEVIKMWERVPFAPMPMNLPNPPPITTQTILQFRAMTKQLEMAASQGRLPQNAFDVSHPSAVLLHGPMMQQQQQQIHPVLAAASLNQNAMAPPDQQANIRQIIEAATRQQQQQQQHDSSLVQQQRNLPVNVPDQNEMQAQLRQLLAQLKNREGFSNLNAQEQQEVLVRQFVASRSMPQNNVTTSNGGSLQDQQEQQAILQQRARMMPFLPAFLTNDQQERLRYQQELERRQKEEAEKQQQQTRLIMEQRMKAEEEKQRLMEEVQKQRQRKQLEENEQKQKQEAEKDRILKLSQLKQQQLAKQHEEFKLQMQNQQRLQQQQQQEKLQQKQQQQQLQIQQQLQQNNQLSTIQQQQQQQIERAKKAAQAQQLQQEQQQRKTAWSTVSKPDQEPVSLATLQKLQEEEKERERERLRQQQQQQQQQQHQQAQSNQQQLEKFQRQMTWASAAQQSKTAPIKTLAEIQKEEEERLAREKQRKAKVQPVVASSGVWNNAASHLSWKNPPSD